MVELIAQNIYFYVKNYNAVTLFASDADPEHFCADQDMVFLVVATGCGFRS
jgi:hypothetical protein